MGVSVIRRILQEDGYSLQANRKKHEGGNLSDRDKQFHHIAQKKDDCQKTKDPYISIDIKKI